MAYNQAFYPMGKTVVLSGSSTLGSANISADSPCSQYLFVNHETSGSQPLYVRISATSGANAAVPTSGTPGYGVPIRPQETLVLSGPQCSSSANVFISFISASQTPTITVTPGEGI
jgi:hypothetical protein